MIGIGPFLTIPFMLTSMGGPHILYAWLAGAVLALCDGLVYAQLGAALPGSGGPYVYLREAYKPFGLGPLDGLPLHLPGDARRAAVDRERRGRVRGLPSLLLDVDGRRRAQPRGGGGAGGDDGAALSQHPRRRPPVGRSCSPSSG